MKFPKLSRHALRKILLISSGAFVVYFVILVWSYCIPDPVDEAFAKRFDDLMEYRAKPDPKEAASEEIDETQLLVLDSEVSDFRAAAAMLTDTAGFNVLPMVNEGAFDAFDGGEISAKFPVIWPYVFAGSSIMTGNALGPEPVVAFYNPYYDVAILTQWVFDANGSPGFKIQKAYPVTGRAFVENRASRADDTQIWDGAPVRIFETALVKAAQDFTIAFENRFSPAGRNKADLSLEAGAAAVALARVEDRVFFFLRWVIDAQNPEADVNYASAIKQLHKALSAPTQAKLRDLLPKDNPQGPEFFFHLEEAVREGMQPYMVVEKNVIFVNPLLMTRAFISVHFEPGESGYEPALVALFDLGTETPVN